MMYSLGVSNSFGVELWNSYTKAYPRALTITVSNFTVATLTNDYDGYILQISNQSVILSNRAAGSWAGRGGIGSSADPESFIVLNPTNNTFLPDSMYRFLTSPPRFVPINTNNFENVPNYPVLNWYLNLSNRMACLIEENNRIVDFCFCSMILSAWT